MPESDMFRAELDMFAESCRTGKPNELNARQRQCRASRWSMPALRSIEQQRPGGAASPTCIADAHKKLAERKPSCCLAAISPT